MQRLTEQLVAAPSVLVTVSASTFTTITQYVTSAAFAVIAALTVRDWLVTRDRSRMYLALAIGSLAAVSILGQVGKLLGSSFVAASAYVTITVFLVSGLALLLFRHAVIPLKPRTLRLVVGIVIATGMLEIGVQAVFGQTAPKPIQLIASAAFVLVWSGCVGEPSVRLWFAARRRTVVQRARMRALSLGYLAIVALLLVAVVTSSLAAQPAIQIGFALATIAIVPLLYAGFVPPAWLRRTWRQSEEDKFQQATHDILLFASDQLALAQRSLDWAIRLTGADAGYFLARPGTILATQGMTDEDAQTLQPAVAGAGGRTVVPLGGTPPRSAMIARLHVNDAAIVLVGGPFTPVFGSDEEAWLQQYAAMVSTGLERVRLGEALAQTNGQLEDKVREVTERTQQLEAANRELEAFSYTISHDLRAPLRAVSGFTSILFEEYADAMPAEARGYLKRVKDSGDHMGHLVDDLLAFSRLGRQAVRTQRVSIRGIVDRALQELSPALDGRQVEVVIGELPNAECDAALVEQVFVNLLSNAFKYSRRREHARVEVGILEANAAEGPTYFVRDNGAGFDMDYAGKLFGVFQRMHRSEDFEGTGVGLAIVHRIIERHGGRIWAEAKVDAGATFYFTLKGAQQWRTTTAA
jgi:signal transduction histidine kinase